MDMKETLFELSTLTAITGMEYRSYEKVKSLFEPFCTSVETDALHNVIAMKQSKSKNATTLLFDAHMDEIGLVVTGITEEGFLKIASLNGVDRRTALAAEVCVHATGGDYFGIITVKPPHLSTEEERTKTLPFDKMYIDVGYSAKKAKEIFRTGDFVTFKAKPVALQDSVVAGKAFDDRAAVVAILYAFEKLKEVELPFHLVAVLSSQEEVGMRGAKVAANRLAPTEAIALDVCHAYTPDAPRDRTATLGKGPCLCFAPILDRAMTKRLAKIAEEENIPLQKEVAVGSTGTNSFAIFNSNEGVKTALISIPVRYMHSIIETMDMSDLKNAGKLLYEYVMKKKESETNA